MSAENTHNPEEEKPQKPKITTEEIEETLRTEARFQEYFKGFRPDSVVSFIRDYAWRKKMWLDYGQSDLERNARAETHWIEAAARHLTYILQKKLFDAQCLWRAEQATYEGVEICYDFRAWEENVTDCPFLEPITEDEVECYRQFLLSPNADLEEMDFEDWQDYRGIKEAYNTDNADRNVPEWYEFHNSRTGASVYMTLPDIRGQKERFYLDLSYGQEREENAAAREEAERLRDKRPSLPYYDKEHLRYFINTFEDARTRELYEAYTYSNRHQDEGRDLHNTIQFLLNADEPIPIERHYDFREALREAAHRYEMRKIADHLPIAYEEYMLNQSLGLRAPSDEENRSTGIADRYRNMILKGRKLAGEPENLNF